MSTPGSRNPRPTRSTGTPSRREREARQRAARQRQQRLIIAGSAIVLLIAIGILVHTFTQSSTTSGGAVSGGNLHPFVGKAPTGLTGGGPVDGVQCGATEGQTQHIHQHLDVVIDGKTETAPPYVGFIEAKKCLYWIHVHPDVPGAIHVEAPIQDTFTLGAFLDIWSVTPNTVYGKPVDHTLLHTIETRTPDVVVVNGQPYGGDIRAIPLQAHTMITIGYGSKSVTQQPFDFNQVDAGAMPTP